MWIKCPSWGLLPNFENFADGSFAALAVCSSEWCSDDHLSIPGILLRSLASNKPLIKIASKAVAAVVVVPDKKVR